MKKSVKKLISITWLSLLILLYLFPLVIAQEGLVIEEAADNVVINIIFGKPSESQEAFQDYPLGKTGAIVSHLMLWLIMFVAFSDIFGSFLPFTNKFVPWIIGFGLTVIFANFGFIPFLVNWVAFITAGLGAVSVFIAMAAAFIGFVAAAILGNRLKAAIASSKIQTASKMGGAKTAGAVKALKAAYHAFEKD